MKIREFVHKNVQKNGIIKGGGAVETTGLIRIGQGCGCSLPSCNCSDGYWISILQPRTPSGLVRSDFTFLKASALIISGLVPTAAFLGAV